MRIDIWILLQWKRLFHNLWFYLMVCILAGGLYLADNLHFPDNENQTIALYSNDQACGQELLEKLLQTESAFQFVQAESEEEVKNWVYGQKADCGFVIEKNFTQALEERNLNRTIRYVASTYTTKGSVAKESVYACALQFLSQEILGAFIDQGTLFEEQGDNLREEVLAANEKLLEERTDSVFVFRGEGKEQASEEENHLPQGLVLLTITLLGLFQMGNISFGNNGGLYAKIGRRKAVSYQFLELLVPMISLAVAGTFLLAVFGSVTEPLRYIRNMFIFLFVCGVWCMGIGKLIRSEKLYYAWIPGWLLGELLVSPMIWNLQESVAGIQVLKWLFPSSYFFW